MQHTQQSEIGCDFANQLKFGRRRNKLSPVLIGRDDDDDYFDVALEKVVDI